MPPERTKLWYLKNLDIFTHMRSMREFKRGEVLYLQGATDRSFYILKKGAVKITKLTPQGNELIWTCFQEVPYSEK